MAMQAWFVLTSRAGRGNRFAPRTVFRSFWMVRYFKLNMIQMHDTTMIFLQEAYFMWSFLGELSSALKISEFS